MKLRGDSRSPLAAFFDKYDAKGSREYPSSDPDSQSSEAFSTNHYQSAALASTTPSGNGVGRHDKQDGGHKGNSWFVLKLTLISALGGFLFGYDTGVVSGAMLLIRDAFHLTDEQQEVVVSITIAAAVVACIGGGPGMGRLGRRPVVLAAAVIFTVGAALLAAARSYQELVTGRLVVGLGIGFASLATPVYIAEAAPTHMRGMLVTLNTLFITVGQVVAGVVDGLFARTPGGWRYMLGLSGIPSVLMTIGFLFLPESPRWLAASGRRTEALSVLRKIRGTSEVDGEFQEIVDSAAEHTSRGGGHATIPELLEDPRTARALVLGCGLQLLQQLSGINTVMYYSGSIANMAGFSTEASIWLAAITAASQSVGVCLGMNFIEQCGRRFLILTSLGLVIVALTCLGTGFYLSGSSGDHEDSGESGGNAYGWLVVLAMMGYLFSFGIGMSSVPWTINAEVYPTHARSLGTSASTATNWLGNVLVSATFLSLASPRALGRDGAFYLYATIGVIGWVWLYVSMPETKGLSLEEVELLFARPGDPPRPRNESMSRAFDGHLGAMGGAANGVPRSGDFALLQDGSGGGRTLGGSGSSGSGVSSSNQEAAAWVHSKGTTGGRNLV